MKKTKAWMAGFLLLVFVFQMAFGALVFADDTDMPEPAGAPNIAVVNGPVFEVEAGKENEVDPAVGQADACRGHGCVLPGDYSGGSVRREGISDVPGGAGEGAGRTDGGGDPLYGAFHPLRRSP